MSQNTVNESTRIRDILEKDRIVAVVNRYCEACDTHNWGAFEQVFAPDLKGSYGGIFQIKNREKLINLIRSMLGGCGPSQHLLGNYRIAVEGNTAHSRCYVRAIHAGAGSKKGLYYEIWGEYRDTLELRDNEWRIVNRELLIFHETGTQEVLGPEVK